MDAVMVLYDEDCGFCRWSAARLRAWDRRDRLRFVPITSPEGRSLLTGIPEHLHLDSMHAVTSDGRVWSAGEAAGPVLRALPGGWVLALVADAAPVLTERTYRAFAHRRATLGRILGEEACKVDPAATLR